MNRRIFLSTVAAGLCAGVLPRRVVAAPEAEAEMPRAVLAGRELPRMGLGAFPLGQLRDEEAGVAVARRALDLGMRYIDTAPSYGNGESERRVGAAVRAWTKDGGRREDLFIATKTLRRDGAGARRELEESLTRLGVEYADSVQCHEVHGDYDRLFGEGAAVPALEKARDEGLIRHIGITGHRNPKFLVEACRRFGFATALVPVNPIDTQHLSFVREFLPFAAERGIGVVAMKVFGGGFLLNRTLANGEKAYSAAGLLHYALSQPGVAVAVPGCERVPHVEEAVAAARGFVALSAEALGLLEGRAGEHEGKRTEWYKDDR